MQPSLRYVALALFVILSAFTLVVNGMEEYGVCNRDAKITFATGARHGTRSMQPQTQSADPKNHYHNILNLCRCWRDVGS